MRRSYLPALGVAVSILAACAGERATGPSAELTALPRPLSAAEARVSQASNDFAFDLLREIAAVDTGDNVFISPLSVAMALGMTANGAADSTLRAMRSTLGVQDTPEAEVNQAYRDLIDLLLGLDPSVTMHLANSVWLHEDFPFHQEFLSDLREYFDASATTLDFRDPATRDRINSWASEQTRGKIPDIIDEIPDEAISYLVNAVYFNGNWRTRFNPASTLDAPFHTVDGGTIPARLMSQTESFRYTETGELQAVELPYGNGAFVMTVVLPRLGKPLAELVSSLDAAQWSAITSSLNEREVDLRLPKFRIEFDSELSEPLSAMGMEIAFTPREADFTRMSPLGDSLYISRVLHKTFVDVHEEGTEAAAVTAVEVAVTSAPIIPTMHVDRPFLVAIRERFSGTLLFLGAIGAPAAP